MALSRLYKSIVEVIAVFAARKTPLFASAAHAQIVLHDTLDGIQAAPARYNPSACRVLDRQATSKPENSVSTFETLKTNPKQKGKYGHYKTSFLYSLTPDRTAVQSRQQARPHTSGRP